MKYLIKHSWKVFPLVNEIFVGSIVMKEVLNQQENEVWRPICHFRTCGIVIWETKWHHCNYQYRSMSLFYSFVFYLKHLEKNMLHEIL